MIYSALLFLCLGTGLATPTVQEMDFMTALDQGLIEVEIRSRGNSSREAADLVVTSKSDHPLQLHIDPGLQLGSEFDHEQDLIVTRPTDILVDGRSRTSSPLYGFCSQSFNGTPTADSQFSINGYADGPLLALAEHLSEGNYSAELEQEAVWNLTGGLPVAGVYTGNQEQDERIRRFLAELKGEEVPSYVVDYGQILDQPFERRIRELSGQFSFFVERNGRIDLVLKGPDNEVITRFFEGQTLSRGQHTTSFSYGSSMLAGVYTFELRINGELIDSSTIEV
jgi:hypothetical protein